MDKANKLFFWGDNAPIHRNLFFRENIENKYTFEWNAKYKF